MKFISHRGNIDGPEPEKENHPDYIRDALKKKFDVEIDIWLKNEKLYLGHNEPQYEIDVEFLKNPHFWCHAKNTEALGLMRQHADIHCFWHQDDDYTLTSRGFIWVYPGKLLVSKCIAVKPESRYSDDALSMCSGICSDIIGPYRNGLEYWVG